MFLKSPRAGTFPLGPDSEPSPLPSPQKGITPAQPVKEGISLERKLHAGFRVQKMREYLSATSPAPASVLHLPSPPSDAKFEEQRRDSAIGSVPILPKLKNDLLWLSLTLILKPTLLPAPVTCRICKQGIIPGNSIGAAAWRMHGCGHQFHVSCFRGLQFIKTSNSHNGPDSESPTTNPNSNNANEPCTTKCRSCENITYQIRILGRQETAARIVRLEDNLLPWLALLQHRRYRRASNFYRTVENGEEEEMVVFVKEGLNARYLRSEGLKGRRVEGMGVMGRERSKEEGENRRIKT
jgi:hypothetical protein